MWTLEEGRLRFNRSNLILYFLATSVQTICLMKNEVQASYLSAEVRVI